MIDRLSLTLAADMLRLSLCYSDMVLLFSSYFFLLQGFPHSFLDSYLLNVGFCAIFWVKFEYHFFKGSKGWYGLLEARFLEPWISAPWGMC